MGLLNQTQQEYYDSNDYGGYQFTSLKEGLKKTYDWYQKNRSTK